MLPEMVMAIIRELQVQKQGVDMRETLAIGSDKRYYAGMSAAYTLAITLVMRGPEKAS